MAAISAPPQLTFTNSSGIPYAGYKLYTYVTSTTTKKTTYPTAADMNASTNQNSNPILLDATGSASVWFSGTAKYVLAPPGDSDPPLSAIGTWDSIPAISTIQIDQFFEAPTSNVISLKPNIDLGVYSGQFIVDENQNPYIKFVKVANAINYVKVTNAALGNSPKIESDGDDTDVGLILGVKNNGDLSISTSGGDLSITSSNGNISAHSVSANVSLEGVNVNLTSSGGGIGVTQPDSRTNTVSTLNVNLPTSGTPASGIGSGIKFSATSADEPNSDFGSVTFSATDVGAGSEDTVFNVQTRVGGQALATKWQFNSTSTAAKATMTHANTVDRTISWPDKDISDFPAGAATSSDQKTGTAVDLYVTPSVQRFHSSSVKAFMDINSLGSLVFGPNVSGVVLNSTGNYTVTMADTYTNLIPVGEAQGAGALDTSVYAVGATSFSYTTSNAAPAFANIGVYYMVSGVLA